MNIVDVVELNEYGIDVEEQDNPMATRYFDDNGGLPEGNFDEDDIEGTWVLISRKHEYDVYAYRSIDDVTLVPNDVLADAIPYVNKLFFQTHKNGGTDFVDGIDWEGLADYYDVEVELEDGIGWDAPHASASHPRRDDHHYYCKIEGENKYIEVDGVGNHRIIEEGENSNPIQWP